MKQQTTLRSLLVITILLLGLSLQAQVVTIHVETPGTLSSYIPSTKKDQITSLTLTGDLNGTDIRYIREMAGRDVLDRATSGKLSILDISGANIVRGGDPYYYSSYYSSSDHDYYYTSHSSSDNIIGDYMFYNCDRLASITIPNGVTSIGTYAFYGCAGLTSVTIPDGVTSIGTYAFYGCIGLTSVAIPDGVTSVGTYAFYGCVGLTSVTIPDGVTSIGTYAFYGCAGLTSVTIPDGVTSIGTYTFYGCIGLASVTIPNSVTLIGDYAFEDCSGLTEILVSEENRIFTSIDGVLFSKDEYTLILYPNSKSNNYSVPNSVTSIGEFAFYGCSGLTSVTIPNSVTSIGSRAFYGCSGIKEIHYNNAIPQIVESSVFNGIDKNICILYVPKGSYSNYWLAPVWGDFTNIIEEEVLIAQSLVHVAAAGTLSSYIASNKKDRITALTLTGNLNGTDIRFIREMAGVDEFGNGTSGKLSVLDISDANIVAGGDSYLYSYFFSSDNTIGNRMFIDCTQLTSISLPNTVTSIGDRTFLGCSGLTSVTILTKVTSIGDGAFWGCSALKEIHSRCTIPPIAQSNSFNGINKITCKLYVPKGSYSSYRAAPIWGDFANIIEESIYYTITTTSTPADKGSVTGAGTFDYNSDVILTATPVTGYNFVNWTVNAAEVSRVNPYVFKTTGTQALVANFKIQSYAIAATAGTGGSLTGASTYEYGNPVSLVAVPTMGYDFVNWTEGGNVVSEDKTFTFTADKARTLVANFQIQSFAISASASAAGDGIITGAATYEYGKPVSLVATAATGYDFVNWTEGGVEVSKALTYTFTADKARTLVANFKIQSYDVAVEIISEGFGTVTGAGTYEYGSTATLVATPAEGYVFDKWIVNSTESTDPTLEFTVTGAVSVQAHFSLYNGMEGTEESTIAVFPTLVKDEFTIAHAEAFKMNVYDNNGRLILSKIVTDAAYVISASDWTSGIYHILLTNGMIVVKERIVKE